MNANDQQNVNVLNSEIIDKLNQLHESVLHTGKVTITDLHDAYELYLGPATTQLPSSRIQNGTSSTLQLNIGNGGVDGSDATTSLPARINLVFTFGFLVFIMILTPIVCEVIQFLLGVRCFVPNNYLVWEATRPVSDCGFCQSVRAPLILKNLTRDEFAPFAYSSRPIIIKNAVSHWPAIKKLNFTYLKNLYESIPGALDEDCQFLHFRSEFMSLRDVFKMSDERVTYNEHEHEDDDEDNIDSRGSNGGHKPWYVGWSNCHPIILGELRKLYPRPHFLPEDAEMPNTDYIFLGYEQGAIMHLDYIPRLMWQAQLQGNKSWILAPAPECDQICHSFEFYVEPGDAVLIDTRIWYHGTSIPKGQFALTIQSEYG